MSPSAISPRTRKSFGSWFRIIRPGLAPSEQVVAIALRNTLPESLAPKEDRHTAGDDLRSEVMVDVTDSRARARRFGRYRDPERRPRGAGYRG